MSQETLTPPSFSRRRRWSIGFNVVLKTVAVLAVLVALNCISVRFFHHRFYPNAQTGNELSQRTRGLLQSMTNRVHVTLYYDKEDALYEDVATLLNEYRLLNRNISVDTVDYLHEAARAAKIKDKYRLFSTTDKNLVIFDCPTNSPPGDAPGRFKVVSGDQLGEFTMKQIPSEDATKPEFLRKPVAFNGEVWFTSTLLQVVNPKPLKAYFLKGHYEPSIDSTDNYGFSTFAEILRQNYIQVESLAPGTNAIPFDCNLLIIAGPRRPIPQVELEQIEKYLDQGGRLFAAFDMFSVTNHIGLENTLAKWGVEVSHSFVRDLVKTHTRHDVEVENFANHPVVNPLTGAFLYMLEPRQVKKIDPPSATVDVPKVQEIAFSSPRSLLSDNSLSEPAALPIMAAVERGAPKGVATERGTTRILVCGDAVFLGNIGITSYANSDFVSFAANWLLDRPDLLQGIGRRQLNNYQLLMTMSQRQTISWILLGAVPGGILLFGGLVWLRRRK